MPGYWSTSRKGIFLETSIAEKVLREALDGSLLKFESHLYLQKGTFEASKLLNRDLSPSQVEGLLRSHGSLPAIKDSLERHGADFGLE